MKMNVEKLVAIERILGNVNVRFLGNLAWYTVADCRICREELEELCVEVGLDRKYVPRAICPRDAFRRACSEGEAQRIAMPSGTYLNLLLRDVVSTGDELVRQLVREVVDSRNVRLEYTAVANVRLQGDTQVVVEGLAPTGAEEEAALERVVLAFADHSQHYNGRHLRGVAAQVIADCMPICVRSSGGVYFVPKDFEPTMMALQRMLEGLNRYSVTAYRSGLRYVPVVDAEEQRAMIEETLEDQVQAESEALITEMTRVLSEGKKVTKGLAEQYVARAKRLQDLVASYEAMLETQAAAARAHLAVALQQAVQMLSHVAA